MSVCACACACAGPLPHSEPSPLPRPTLPVLGLPKCLGACLALRQAARPACVGRSPRSQGRVEHWRSARKTGAPLGTLRQGAELSSQASAPPPAVLTLLVFSHVCSRPALSPRG